MNDPFGRPPRFGTTDWAAQRIRALLDEEDRRKPRLAGRATSQTAQASPVNTNSAAHAAPGEGPADVPVYSQSQTHPYPPPHLALRQTPESRRALIDSIIAREGGYSNNPSDSGGPTKFGITQDAIDEYRNRVDGSFSRTPAGLSRDEAVQIYDGLIKEYRLDRIADPDLRAQVIDIMVNSDIGSAGEMLLDVLERRGHDVRIDPSDNVIGSRTLGILRDLVNRRADAELARINNELVTRRKEHLSDVIQADPKKEEFRKNWMNRANSFRFLPTGRQR